MFFLQGEPEANMKKPEARSFCLAKANEIIYNKSAGVITRRQISYGSAAVMSYGSDVYLHRQSAADYMQMHLYLRQEPAEGVQNK